MTEIRMAFILTEDEPLCGDDDCEACNREYLRRQAVQEHLDGEKEICPGCGRNGNQYCARGCPEATAKGWQMDPWTVVFDPTIDVNLHRGFFRWNLLDPQGRIASQYVNREAAEAAAAAENDK